MAEPNKQYTGDGQDNPGQAVQKGAEAIKQASQAAGVEATSNAATAAVSAAAEGGQAAAGIAAGTAAAGPWGAILSAAWAMRHTLFKILVCICLLLLFLITAVISLPSIIANNVFRTDPDSFDPNAPAELNELADMMSEVVAGCIQSGQDTALAEVERIIEDKGYDYELSMEALINYSLTPDYDVCYVLAAYSASMNQKGTTATDLKRKLEAVTDRMFSVTYTEKTEECTVPVTYATYKAATITAVTSKTQTGTINGVPQYRYTTASRIYYVPDGEKTSDTAVSETVYVAVSVEMPVYSGGAITGTKTGTYYTPEGTTTYEPETETITYGAFVIHPFDSSVIHEAFGIDPNATYDQFGVTYDEAINTMTYAMKMTLYGTANGDVPPITDSELLAILNNLDCSNQRKELIRVGLSLVGRVPYFWGGKATAGWNEDWGKPRLVTAPGSSSSGTIRPYGLDCSGFVDWCYKTAGLGALPAGTYNQWAQSTAISADELLPGDLGFMAEPGSVPINHVLMYVGRDSSGNMLWVHCASSTGVVLNSPNYVKYYRRMTGYDLENDDVVIGGGTNVPGSLGEPLEVLQVNVTHYCACSKCCGQWDDGITASGKTAAPGMVAMSSQWPFGTLIEINGTVYTVEDRGGSNIENDRTRVDIFVYDHQEALRLGRFWTEAKIYRIGR